MNKNALTISLAVSNVQGVKTGIRGFVESLGNYVFGKEYLREEAEKYIETKVAGEGLPNNIVYTVTIEWDKVKDLTPREFDELLLHERTSFYNEVYKLWKDRAKQPTKNSREASVKSDEEDIE